MENSNLTSYIELVSIVSATGFGILGAVTETKNKEGKLTKWGIIAIVGIIVSSSISFTRTYLNQREEERRLLAEQVIEGKKYQHEVSLLKDIIRKTDSSTTTQLDIQRQTKSFITNLKSSIKIQEDIYSKTDKLLNPFCPFAVDYNFSIEMKPPTKTWLKDLDDCIDGPPPGYLKMLDEITKGTRSPSYYDDGWYCVTPKLCNLEEIFDHSEIHIKFYTKEPKADWLLNQDNFDLWVKAKPRKIRPYDTLEYYVHAYQEIGEFFYFKQEDGLDKYKVMCYTDMVEVMSDRGTLKSISDLKKCIVVVYITSQPHCLPFGIARGEMRLLSLGFHFPPNASNVHELEITDDGVGYGDILSANKWE